MPGIEGMTGRRQAVEFGKQHSASGGDWGVSGMGSKKSLGTSDLVPGEQRSGGAYLRMVNVTALPG